MDTSDKPEITPRRSTRLLRQNAVTPETKTLGPRELMLLNKSRQKNDGNSSVLKKKAENIEINIIPATPVQEKSRKRSRSIKIVEKPEKHQKIESSTENIVNKREEEEEEVPKNVVFETKSSEQPLEEEEVQKVVQIKPKINDTDNQIAEPQLKPNESEEFHSAINENDVDKVATHDETIKPESMDAQSATTTSENPTSKSYEPNETPQLMDESIISVPESPPMAKTTVKDSTFSPEVDTSIQDARPHIDVDKIFDMSSIHVRNVGLRTSTPLSQRLFARDTPKLSDPVKNALKKILLPKNEECLNEAVNGQFKMTNPLEKSILKSSRRKRSLSVADGDSFMHKKVIFMSPEIMNIDTIDEKMLQSFRDEKENSIFKHQMASGSGIRKRSLSASGTPSKKKIKVPNFKAIHEKQFKQMESISDFQRRKAQRAKMLVTPSKILSTVPESKKNDKKVEIASKIPTRKPLGRVLSSENIAQAVKPRAKKRSNSVDVSSKPLSGVPNKKVNNTKEVTGLPRIFGENSKIPQPSQIHKFNIYNVKALPSITKPIVSGSALMRSKVEERRDKNMSLYKGNAVKTGLDHRKKNENVLKGVRLNRRFELQMKHRRMEESDD